MKVATTHECAVVDTSLQHRDETLHTGVVRTSGSARLLNRVHYVHTMAYIKYVDTNCQHILENYKPSLHYTIMVLLHLPGHTHWSQPSGHIH